MNNNRKSKGLIVIIIILIVFIVILGGYIVCDKVSTNNKNSTNTNDNNNSMKKTSYNSYNIGDKVTVKLNDSTEAIFYVLKQSDKTEEFVTLFAEKNIGTSAFNNDYTDGNNFKGSLIESKLNELTNSWTNVKDKRLITVDEIIATGLTTKKQCGPSENDLCDTVKNNSWLTYNDELYWTMTKTESNENSEYDEGKYIYYVDLNGVITGHIVGYTPGEELNKDGTFFDNFGIRPVIEISKKFIK